MDPPDWTTLGDTELLELKIASLGLRIEGSEVAPLVQRLYDELEAKGLVFHPPCFVADEWFCPIGTPAIGIPFFLLHDRLRRLERKVILEVEGESESWFMRLMRHEAGHAYSYAYNLYRKKKWQAHFGLASTEETDTYRPRPYSRSYVVHLDDWYAQSHPDEDFAETFAVWLTPRYPWRRRYAGWPALRKLEWVDEVMRELRGVPPAVRGRRIIEPLSSARRTLGEHYADKQEHYSRWRPTVQDRDLQRLFPARPGRPGEPASGFLKRNRNEIRRLVSRFTGESPFTLERVLDDVIASCRVLDLRTSGSERRLRVDVALLLTVRTVHFHYSRRNWVAL
jgi:hypothetical protein